MAFAEYVETKTGSWRPELEDRGTLAEFSSSLPYASYSDGDLPEVIDPQGWTIIEDQGQIGSCQGNALASAVEQCHVRQGGDIIQLSRMGAYIRSQHYDNIRGDRGSTLSGGAKVAQEGLVLEEVWPYPSRYSSAIPPGFQSATRYKTEGFTEPKTYDETVRHLGLYGPVHIGIPWNSVIDQQASRTGIIDEFRPGRADGGHSVLFGGYTMVDWAGRPLSRAAIKLGNSWSRRWGKDGWALVTERAINAMLAHAWTVFMGHFGAPHPEIKGIEYDR